MFCVYLIKSQKVKGWKYIGSTNDLTRGIEEHNNGKAVSTKNYRLFVLAYYEAYVSKEDAREREKQLKYFGNAYKFLMKRIRHSL
jgi:predicted GIY-YIG superfamily endonuclease